MLKTNIIQILVMSPGWGKNSTGSHESVRQGNRSQRNTSDMKDERGPGKDGSRERGAEQKRFLAEETAWEKIRSRKAAWQGRGSRENMRKGEVRRKPRADLAY